MSEIPSVSIFNGYGQEVYLIEECINHYTNSYVFRKHRESVVLYRQTNRLRTGDNFLLLFIFNGNVRIPVLFDIVEAYTRR